MQIRSSSPTTHSERKIFFSVLGVCIVGSIVAFMVLGCVSIYLLSSRTWPVVFLSRLLPFPAASVNGTWIPFSVWASDTNAFVALAEQGKPSIPSALSRPDIGRAVMQTLIRNQVIVDLAKKQGIEVTSMEIDAAFADLQKTTVSKDALRTLHWSDATIKEQIVLPSLLGKRLAERLGSVTAADTAVQDAMKKAEAKVFLRL